MKRRHEVDTRLDLIPVLSVIVHLIPMLLLAVRFVTLHQHLVDHAPIHASPAPSREKVEEQDRERVAVRITASGFVVKGAAEGDTAVPCRGSCTAEDYDVSALSDVLVEARARHPNTQQVVLAPDKTVPYAVIIGVFDAATRHKVGDRFEVLFSDPVLVDGAGEPPPAPVAP